MKKLIPLVIIMLLSVVAFSQDVHLSQFYMNSQNLNPAYTGNYDGNYRITGNFRSQWWQIDNEPLATVFLGGEKKFSLGPNNLGLGVLLIRDQFNGFNSNVHKAQLAASYHLNLGKKNKVLIGAQGGLLQRSTDLNKYVLSEQWNQLNGSFDGIPSFDLQNNFIDQDWNLDINGGLGWTGKFKKFEPSIGFAMNHINRPEDSYFKDAAQRLQIRYVGDAGFNWRVAPKFSIEPKALFMTTTNTQDLIFGSNFRYIIKEGFKPLSIYAGVFNRGDLSVDNDALIPTIGARINRWEVGLSYDYNTSTLSDYFDQKSSFEIGVRYITPSAVNTTISSPCDRF